MKNWKTSIGGVLAGLSLMLGQVATLFDGKPETNPDFAVIIAAAGMLGVGLSAKDG